MDKVVLVAYASKHGSTKTIAEKIADQLRSAGLNTDISNVKDADNPGNYDALVLGSAVYIGGWRKEAVKFVEQHANSLTKLPVWIFSSGPTGEGDPVKLLDGWMMPDKLKPVFNQIKPREVVVFHGNVDLQKLNFLEKTMVKNVKSPIGDYRDWAVISEWAMKIAEQLMNLPKQ